MPIVASFFGITIRMFFTEHEPPHFHAEHQNERATFDFNGTLQRGMMRSGAARRSIRAWAQLHRLELDDNWHRIQNGLPLEPIPPLP